MLSSQMLWPRSCNAFVVFIFHLPIACRKANKFVPPEAPVIAQTLSGAFTEQDDGLQLLDAASSVLDLAPSRFLTGSRSWSGRAAIRRPDRKHGVLAAPAPIAIGAPGTFIRASLPRFNKSCSGAIASAAREDQPTPSKPARLRRSWLPALLRISRCSVAGPLSTLQTTPEWWDCRACPCKPPCWSRSFPVDMDCPHDRRRRIARPACREDEIDPAGHKRPA